MKKVIVIFWAEDDYQVRRALEQVGDIENISVANTVIREVTDFWLDPHWTVRANKELCEGDYRTNPPDCQEPEDLPPDTEKSE